MSEFLNNQPSPYEGQFPDGHPVRTYLEENILIRSLMAELETVNINLELDKFREIFEKLAKVDLHFTRKEN